MTRSGRQVGNFRVEQLLGHGSSGEVYAAWDELLERNVALKFLHVERDDPSHRALLGEARLLCRLDHPNVCRVFDLEVDQGRDVLVLERIQGVSLADLSPDANRQRAIGLARQVASALAAAHEVGIVHRDLKPENILVTPDGVAKVLDFGLATLLARSGEPVAGTLDWMSPEQARGETTSPATDVYSLGLLCHRLLSGKLPYPEVSSFRARLDQRRTGAVALAPELAAGDRALLTRLLDPRPDRRPTAGEAAILLGRLYERLAAAPSRRRTLWRRGLATVAMALAVAAALTWWSERRAQSERHAVATIRLTVAPVRVTPPATDHQRALLDGYRDALVERLRRLRGVAVVAATEGAANWNLELAARSDSEPPWEIVATVASPGRQRRFLARSADTARSFAQIGDWLEEQIGAPRGLAAGLSDPFTIQLFALARQEMALRGFVSARPFYETLAALEPKLGFARIQIANGLWQEGKVAEADTAWTSLLASAELTDDERAETLYNLIFDAAERHDAEQYDRLRRQFEDLVQRSPTVEPLAWEAEASAELHFGRAAASIAAYRRLEDRYRESGRTQARAEAMRNLADALLYERRLDEARGLLVEVEAIAATLDSPRLGANTQAAWARWAILAGEATTSAGAIARARAVARELADQPLLAELDRLDLLSALRFDELGPALTKARAKAQRLSAEHRLGDRDDFLYEASMALSARGEVALARRFATER